MTRLRKNKGGGIEGLPLQLMIIILVAALGSAVILGWMSSLNAPSHIGSVNIDSGDITLDKSSGSQSYTESGYVKIFVTDQNGDGLAGATVVLSGCNVTTKDGKTVHGVTDANGYAEFSDLHISLRGAKMGFITVDVSKSGYGTASGAKIPVIT
ncbi:MAG: carboxypeptidase-like regulatory domain-containing protein [Methanomassiliicoccaceae archaeon]|nr:carboxypeptidase-like regulatory domain-containing protein [Methanomassiliicoccaceae archaeon]